MNWIPWSHLFVLMLSLAVIMLGASYSTPPQGWVHVAELISVCLCSDSLRLAGDKHIQTSVYEPFSQLHKRQTALYPALYPL